MSDAPEGDVYEAYKALEDLNRSTTAIPWKAVYRDGAPYVEVWGGRDLVHGGYPMPGYPTDATTVAFVRNLLPQLINVLKALAAEHNIKTVDGELYCGSYEHYAEEEWPCPAVSPWLPVFESIKGIYYGRPH